MRLVVLGLLVLSQAAKAQVQRVRPNDNRARAGVLGPGLLALRFEARIADWRPQGDDAPGALVPVFQEIGRPPSIPGPLIRVKAGTEVRIVVRNAIPNVLLTIHGLHARPIPTTPAFSDSIVLKYAEIQSFSFRLDRPGTYYYWGTTTGASFDTRTQDDAQLTGAIVVDEPDERVPRDRIFMLGMWADSAMSETRRHRTRELFVINGRSWPYTDRVQYEKGETVQWRLINGTSDLQPMHLQEFFMRVRRRGDARVDTVLGRPEVEHTERLLPGATATLSWTADRLGNFVFRSHTPASVAPRGPMGVGVTGAAPALWSATTGWSGMVTGIEIKPAEDDTTTGPPPGPPDPQRRLRMVLRPNAGSTPPTPFYGVTVDTTGLEPDVDVGQHIGPPIILTRAQPVSIVVKNGLAEPTSIHWHGMELTTDFDDVPGVSGIRPAVATAIAPGDSFDVRLLPMRSGTFMYHSQVNEIAQQRAGIVGALIVVDKGKWDPMKDFPILFSSPSDSIAEEHSVLINGSNAPLVLDLKRAAAYRLRLMNSTTARQGMQVTLRLATDTVPTTWRPIAKDGIDIPAPARSLRTARQPLSIGETMDVEFFPTRVGEYRLEARTRLGAVLATLPIKVQ